MSFYTICYEVVQSIKLNIPSLGSMLKASALKSHILTTIQISDNTVGIIHYRCSYFPLTTFHPYGLSHKSESNRPLYMLKYQNYILCLPLSQSLYQPVCKNV